MWQTGPTDSLVDVRGLRVGHHQRVGDGWLTGTTVVLAPPGGMVAGVDVRGGGPGTRETDLLDPRATVQRVHAVVLGGGSAFGLAAADGVMQRLARDGIGFPVGPTPAEVVPIVPAAIVFDLGRGGDFGNRPDHLTGALAYDAAAGPSGTDKVAQGCVGAGTGAVAGALKGGVGSASQVVAGVTVGALAVVNAAGSTVDPATGRLYGLLGDGDAPVVSPEKLAEARAQLTTTAPGQLNTTIGVVATDATLTKAECAALAGIAHDGMARAIRPVHTVFDGDTVFGLSMADLPPPDLMLFNQLLIAAADTFQRAVAAAMLAAESVGPWPSYRDLLT
jgi:L-aminopeptidase/D-esterase-like protein